MPEASAPASANGAREACFHAASNVIRILTSYRQQYGLKRAHVHVIQVITTAAIMHTYFYTLYRPQEGNTAQESLVICLQALGEMGQTYRSASRALEAVASLKDSWRSRARQKIRP